MSMTYVVLGLVGYLAGDLIGLSFGLLIGVFLHDRF